MKTLSVIALVSALCIATPVMAANIGVTVGANGGANTNASSGSSQQGGGSSSQQASGASSQQGSGASSSAMPSQISTGTSNNTGQCNSGGGTGSADTAALAGATNVTVIAVTDCSGLTLDQGAGAALQGNATVAAAIQKAGYSGDGILGYMMDGSSLTVYVKQAK